MLLRGSAGRCWPGVDRSGLRRAEVVAAAVVAAVVAAPGAGSARRGVPRGGETFCATGGWGSDGRRRVGPLPSRAPGEHELEAGGCGNEGRRRLAEAEDALTAADEGTASPDWANPELRRVGEGASGETGAGAGGSEGRRRVGEGGPDELAEEVDSTRGGCGNDGQRRTGDVACSDVRKRASATGDSGVCG